MRTIHKCGLRNRDRQLAVSPAADIGTKQKTPTTLEGWSNTKVHTLELPVGGAIEMALLNGFDSLHFHCCNVGKHLKTYKVHASLPGSFCRVEHSWWCSDDQAGHIAEDTKFRQTRSGEKSSKTKEKACALRSTAVPCACDAKKGAEFGSGRATQCSLSLLSMP